MRAIPLITLHLHTEWRSPWLLSLLESPFFKWGKKFNLIQTPSPALSTHRLKEPLVSIRYSIRGHPLCDCNRLIRDSSSAMNEIVMQEEECVSWLRVGERRRWKATPLSPLPAEEQSCYIVGWSGLTGAEESNNVLLLFDAFCVTYWYHVDFSSASLAIHPVGGQTIRMTTRVELCVYSYPTTWDNMVIVN